MQKKTDQLKSFSWFSWTSDKEQSSRLLAAISKAAIGATVGLLLFIFDHKTFAFVVWGISGIIGLISISSERGHTGLTGFFAIIGEWVGRIFGIILLAPIYFVVFTFARVLNRLRGQDILHLRDNERVTFWLECDKDERKRRHINSMFVTEAPIGRRRGVIIFFVVSALIIVAAELLLQFAGFGNPILYVDDVVVGFYPAANQDVLRYVNKRVSINRFGMRAPDYPAEKAEGNFRILMLGDSTLYGGSYVDQEDIYARQLEKRLNASGRDGKVEIFNMGVNAWGPFHKLGYIERFGTFDADVAIICLPIGDVERPLSRLSGGPFCPVNAPPRLGLNEMLWHLTWRYRARRIGEPTAESVEIQTSRGIEAYCRLAKRLTEAGCEVLIEILPGRSAATSDTIVPKEKRLVAQFRQHLESNGYVVGFPAGFLKGKGKQKELYHDGYHLHWRGHRLYAEYLYERICRGSVRFKDWCSSNSADVVKDGGKL